MNECNSAPNSAHVNHSQIQRLALGISSQVYTEVYLQSTPVQ